MKTTSSQLCRGVMLIAVLLVPATTWWVSLRYYQAQKQAESALAAEKTTQQQQIGGLKSKRKSPLPRLDSGSVEFAPVEVIRTSWNGQTDPDGVWHDQRLKANKTLMDHGLPALNGPGLLPDSAPVSRTRRLNGQK